MAADESSVVIGIDLGRQFARAALISEPQVVEEEINPDGTPAMGGGGRATAGARVVADVGGERATPVAVFLGEGDLGEALGWPALQQSARRRKRVIKRAYEAISVTSENAAAFAAGGEVAVVADEATGGVVFQLPADDGQDEGTKVTPRSVIARVLRALKESSQGMLGARVQQCVLTVACDASERARAELVAAAEEAGLEVVQMMLGPIAAAVGSGLDMVHVNCVGSATTPYHALVIDVGVGTEAALIEVMEGGVMRVVDAVGNPEVGGTAIDEAIGAHFAKAFKRKCKLDLTESPRAVAKLQSHIQTLKQVLSNSSDASLSIDSLYEGVDFNAKLNRSRFDMIVSKILAAAVATATDMLEAHGLDTESVGTVILVGGCANIPRLQKLVCDTFGEAKSVISRDPSEVVVCGAAVQGAVVSVSPEHDADEMAAAAESTSLTGEVADVDALNREAVAMTEAALSVRAGDTLVPLVAAGAPVPAEGTQRFACGPGGGLLTLVEGEGETAVDLVRVRVEPAHGKDHVTVSVRVGPTGDLAVFCNGVQEALIPAAAASTSEA